MKKYLNYFIAIATIFLFNFFFGYDSLSASAVGIFAYWLSALLFRSNHSLPIKELFLSLYSLQYLFGSALMYNGFDYYYSDYNKMKITSEDYFTFVIPVFLCFCLGFNIFVKKNSIKINRDQIDQWLNVHPQAPYYFIVIGFILPLVSGFIPNSFDFILYFLSAFKFIGLFILLMSYRTIKPLLMVGIYGAILISSFQGGMFHDLLTWLIFLAIVLTYRYKPNWTLKTIGIVLFALFAIFIQSIKSGLREQTWLGNKQTSIALVEEVSNNVSVSNGGLLSMNNLGPNVIRINQGFFLASTMNNVPRNIPHTHGALIMEYLYAAIVPRIFDANKLKSGGHEFTNLYAGLDTVGETSMPLGLFSDAYIDFGKFGAIVCVFFIGLMYGYILNQFFTNSNTFPILILFAVLAFIYPMRPDTETQTAFGHLFKTIMLLWLMFKLYPSFFKIPSKNF